MPCVQLKNLPNYFIHTEGYVFKIENGKEVIIPNRQSKKTKKLFVYFEGKHYELLYLMMEYFDIKMKSTDAIKYTITKDLRIPANSIRIRQFTDKFGLSKQDEAKLYQYKCDHKANGANARTAEKITPVEIYTVLKTHNYCCVYCGSVLNPDTWHLDHFISLARGGKNVFANLVPACNVCNIMKGALEGHQFHKRCLMVAKNFAFLNDCDNGRKAAAASLPSINIEEAA